MKTQQVAFRGVLLAFIGLLLPSSPTAFGESGCRIVTDGPRIELHSPFFVFSLPTAFAESSRTVELKVRDKNQPSENDSSIWTVLSPSTAVSKGGITLTKQPVELAEGGTLTFTLDQGYRDGPADHTIGRFRVSVTTAKPPLPHPIVKDAQRFAIEAQAPASSRGGTFVVAAELKKGTESVFFGNIGTYFSSEAKLAGQPVVCQPVLGKCTYPSSWQAWRIVLAPSAKPRTVELSVSASLPGAVKCVFQGHFIPTNRADPEATN